MSANLNRYELVLFDFDGTIADTARDMINALNLQLRSKSRPSVNYDKLRAYVSNGTPALLHKGFGCSPGDCEYESLRQEYLRIYRDNLCVLTQLYTGTDAILQQCENTGIAWGIVTNKPEHLTRLIVDHLELSDRVACIVGGDTLKQRKPDPAPVIHACRLAGSSPESAIFVGDSWRDIEAGRRAGLTTVGATYGYIPPDDDPNQWGADYTIDSITEMTRILWANSQSVE